MFIYRISSFVNAHKKAIKNHFIGWTVFFFIDLLSVYHFTNGDIPEYKYIRNVIFVLIWFYLNLYAIFLPLLPKRIWEAVLKGILLLFIFICFKLYFENITGVINIERSIYRLFLGEVFRLASITFFAFSYWIYLESIKEQKERRIAESKLLKSEIAFLKAQINPHFVFNVLNFVYNNVARVSPKSGEAILSLTKLMRYSVESTSEESSSLGNEIEMIDELIRLQALRFGSKLQAKFIKHGTIPFFSIPPLVFLSIVENAFKYGIIDDPANPIEIEIEANKDQLFFRCKNKKRLDFKDTETTAVGQINTKRRLEIAFPNRYEFNINESGVFYEVQIKIFWLK